MASLTSNPMEDMDEEYQEGSVGIRRSWANPGSEQTRPQPPNTLNFTSGEKCMNKNAIHQTVVTLTAFSLLILCK